MPKPYDYLSRPRFESIRRENHYVSMRDGVKIAVTVYLPKDLPTSQSIPSLLHQTRYWRTPKLIPPLDQLTLGLLGPDGQRIKEMVRQGYAFVSVDARGSGASYGSRAHPWTRDEVADGVEIADWIVSQPWSDGQIGVLGISYSSTAGEFLVYQEHPAVKAGFLMFSLFDVYTDIALPGGIPFDWFTENWGRANASLDRNQLPMRNLLLKLLVRGVLPVNGDRKALKEAMQAHLENADIHAQASELEFRDDVFDPEKGDTLSVFSPYAHLEKLGSSPVPLYHYSGWWDGAYQWSAIRRFLNDGHPDSRLLIGPWEHRGRLHISPGFGGKVQFDHLSELLKFFDQHLKGIDTGIREEAKVQYYTMRAERWQGADQWPPVEEPGERGGERGVSVSSENKPAKSWFFAPDRKLQREPVSESGRDSYAYQPGLGSGTQTRWRSMVGQLTTPHGYGNLAKHNRRALCYTSAPLSADLEITGHPQLNLWLESSDEDLHLFAYLEEVLPNGKVLYITEGLLRASFYSSPGEEAPIYQDALPARRFRKGDQRFLEPGKKTEIMIPFFPTSYQLQKGSCLRVAITLGDADHFAERGTENTRIELNRGGEQASYLLLP